MKVFSLRTRCFVGIYDMNGKFINFHPVPSHPNGWGSCVDCWNWIYKNGIQSASAVEVYL